MTEESRPWRVALRINPSTSIIKVERDNTDHQRKTRNLLEVIPPSSSSSPCSRKDRNNDQTEVVLIPPPLRGDECQQQSTPSPMTTKSFSFPYVFYLPPPPSSPPTQQHTHSQRQQRHVYETLALPLVQDVINGYNVTFMAYGSSGSGKTYSLFGETECVPVECEGGCEAGLLPRLTDDIFKRLQEITEETTTSTCTHSKASDATSGAGKGAAVHTFTYRMTMSMHDILYEQVFDLLHHDGLNVYKRYEGERDDEYGYWRVKQEKTQQQAYVRNLTEVEIHSVYDLLTQLQQGHNHQQERLSYINEDIGTVSTKHLHTIVTLTLIQSYHTFNENDYVNHTETRTSRITFCDMKGSERQAIVKQSPNHRLVKNGCKVGLSYSAFGNVISSLVESATTKSRKVHIPYRDSLLTRLLQDSFGGNTIMTVLGTVSMPFVLSFDDNEDRSSSNSNDKTSCSYDECLSTLRYLSRMKHISNQSVKANVLCVDHNFS